MTKKGNTRLIIGIVLGAIILLSGFSAWLAYNQNNNAVKTDLPQDQLKHLSKGKEVNFIGHVTAVRDDCKFDGICSITVRDKEIIMYIGGDIESKEPSGSIIGADRFKPSERLGKKVKIYAKATSKNTLTIIGNEKYYIEYLGQ